MSSTQARGTCPTRAQTAANPGARLRTGSSTTLISSPLILIRETRITSLPRPAAAFTKLVMLAKSGKRCRVFLHSRVALAQFFNTHRFRGWFSRGQLKAFGGRRRVEKITHGWSPRRGNWRLIRSPCTRAIRTLCT